VSIQIDSSARSFSNSGTNRFLLRVSRALSGASAFNLYDEPCVYKTFHALGQHLCEPVLQLASRFAGVKNVLHGSLVSRQPSLALPTEALAAYPFSQVFLMPLGISRARQAAALIAVLFSGAAASTRQADTPEGNYYANAHPYFDESLKDLTKQIPDLKNRIISAAPPNRARNRREEDLYVLTRYSISREWRSCRHSSLATSRIVIPSLPALAGAVRDMLFPLTIIPAQSQPLCASQRTLRLCVYLFLSPPQHSSLATVIPSFPRYPPTRMCEK
jgi:hypothetical protein